MILFHLARPQEWGRVSFRFLSNGRMAFAPDGKSLAVSNFTTVALWSLADGRMIRELSGVLDQINDVQFSPDGKVVAAASNDPAIVFWDPATGSENYSTDSRANGRGL